MKVLVAFHRLICPFCDGVIRKGETYIEKEGRRICLRCGLPARRLKPINHSITTN
jgi:hypothetical protein